MAHFHKLFFIVQKILPHFFLNVLLSWLIGNVNYVSIKRGTLFFLILYTLLNCIWLASSQKLVLCIPEGIIKKWGFSVCLVN